MKIMKNILFKIILMCNIIWINNCFGQADCPATCLYNNNNITGATASTGLTTELNASNRGCLATNEATTSIWYQICFSTNGVFQFEIRPNGTDNDYDFAVWRGINCPPTTQPIRCSYAVVGTQDRTGLLPSETDVSEGAGGNQYVDTIRVLAGQCYIVHINNFASGSNTFNFRLNGTTATINCPSLPIIMQEFNGYNVNTYNVITYKTEYSHTYLEKLINNEWITISMDNDIYNDYKLMSNSSYYRLKLEDLNGIINYSQILEIQNPNYLLISPNPVFDMLNLSNTKVNFEIYSIDSKLIMKGFDNQINMTNFNSGIYFININNYYYKIIIQ